LAKRYRPTIQHSLKESFTLVVVDCFEVCALIVANRVKIGEKREGTFKDDYEKGLFLKLCLSCWYFMEFYFLNALK
jgi:hypothetical protein